ncbi:MAG: LamG-like jellyroll fold domain-containing protein [Bacteroidota bacterium]
MKNNYFKALLTLLLMLAASAGLKAQSNQYLDFDMVDDHVLLENGSQYLANKPGMTITGWFYDNQLAYGQGMMGFRGSQGFYMIELSNGTIECRFINSANTLFEYVAPANTIIPMTWQHFAWVYDGSAIKLYVNGVLKGSKAATGSFTATNIPFAVGRSIAGGGLNFFWGGRIDEVSAWSKALSQAEIQAMVQNELTGSETGLQMYYKFNQGVPGGNNTSITKLTSKVDSPVRDADILNFAMVGLTSNFEGTLDTTYQAISFAQIPNKLNTAPPFDIAASSTSGLDVTFNILSGPASIAGNTITLTGDTGKVVVEATQPGNSQYNPAEPVIQSFMVLNPNWHVPAIDPRNPLAGDVHVPSLSQIQLAAISTITYPELFSVAGVQFRVNGQTIEAQNFWNGHFTAWWTPPSYGSFAIEILSTNNFGAVASKIVNVNIVPDATDVSVDAFKDIWLSPTVSTANAEAQLPSYLGAYDKITATLKVHCPTGGCGAWDRVASVDARDKEGNWFQIIKYITPYGVACSHDIDLTDYMSMLQGKVTFRVNCATLDNGFLYDLSFDFHAGTPAHKYSTVKEVWKNYYPFGDYAKPQPVDTFNYTYPDNAVASKLKLVSTGHGWGDLNTGNAAEFYDATHNIWVNGVKTFTQHNWTDCNPNPDGCQPQNGTWYYDRAGWCPGSIAKWFDFDMNAFVPGREIELRYVFYEQYMDQCHPNNPACVTGVTCTNCSDGFNPALDVACNLVTFSDSPIIIVGKKDYVPSSSVLNVFPNPTLGKFEVSLITLASVRNATILIYDNTGRPVTQMEWDGQKTTIDLSSHSKGIYLLKVVSPDWTEMKKIILK